MAFQDKLKELMTQKNMKAVDLARATGLSEAAISDYLKGKKEPRGRQSIAIAEALRVSLDTLWETGFQEKSFPTRPEETQNIQGLKQQEVTDLLGATDSTYNGYEIGARIKDRRQELSMTLQDVANEVGISKSTVLRYENGSIGNIKLPVIEAIARSLQINPAYLLGKSNEKSVNLLSNQAIKTAYAYEKSTSLDESSQLLLSNYEQLNDEGKEKLISYSNDLVDTGRYLKENQSGLGEKKMA